MKDAKRWNRNESFEIDVVENGENKLHLVLKNTHILRKDGSLTQEAAMFYAYNKWDGDWKIFSILGFIFHAQY